MKEKITLQHGDGTRASYDFIKEMFVARLGNPVLNELADAAVFADYAFSCDSFTVKPLFFPSSNIGFLSVYGTVNDICVSAAIPRYLSLAVVVEEGFRKKDLERIVDSIRDAAACAQVEIVSGDFKVVPRRAADKIFITSSGIGLRIKKRNSSFSRITPQDKVIITGPIAEHGAAVMLARSRIFDFDITSDCASLAATIIPLWKRFPGIKFMRDPTRGGLAGVLNEICLGTGLGVRVFERNVPIAKSVRAACELLGLDPYYLACEGRAIIVAAPDCALKIVAALRKSGQTAARIIGDISRKGNEVILKTVSGGERVLDFTYSRLLPRIC